jgi:hypothetical protein
MIGCGKVGSGTAVKVRQGEARRGKVRFGMARRLWHGGVRRGVVRQD